MAVTASPVAMGKAADLWWSRWTTHSSVWMTGDSNKNKKRIHKCTLVSESGAQHLTHFTHSFIHSVSARGSDGNPSENKQHNAILGCRRE